MAACHAPSCTAGRCRKSSSQLQPLVAPVFRDRCVAAVQLAGRSFTTASLSTLNGMRDVVYHPRTRTRRSWEAPLLRCPGGNRSLGLLLRDFVRCGRHGCSHWGRAMGPLIGASCWRSTSDRRDVVLRMAHPSPPPIAIARHSCSGAFAGRRRNLSVRNRDAHCGCTTAQCLALACGSLPSRRFQSVLRRDADVALPAR